MGSAVCQAVADCPVAAAGRHSGQRGIGEPRRGQSISPVLANLYLHYAMDTWLVREFPGVTFERYCDDAVIHCGSEEQARHVRDAARGAIGVVGSGAYIRTRPASCIARTRTGVTS